MPRSHARGGSVLTRPEPAGAVHAASGDGMFRTVVALLVLPATLLLASACATLLALAGGPSGWIDAVYTGFARFAAWVGGTRLHVAGAGHVQPGTAYVVVPNHESDWDPVVAFAALPQLRLRAVVKEQIARIPVFGSALLRTGNVRVERTHTPEDVRRIREAMAVRRPDVSMLFYAEGTRSRDGAFQEFRKGAFATAIAHRLPILPVGTAGTRRIWAPRTLWLRSGPVTVEIGAPIPVDGLTLDDRDRLRDEAHRAVAALRATARHRLRALGVEPGGDGPGSP